MTGESGDYSDEVRLCLRCSGDRNIVGHYAPGGLTEDSPLEEQARRVVRGARK